MDSSDSEFSVKSTILKLINSSAGSNQSDAVLLEKFKHFDGCEVMMFADFIHISRVDNTGAMIRVLSSRLQKKFENALGKVYLTNIDIGLNDLNKRLPIKVVITRKPSMLLDDKFEESISFAGIEEDSCMATFSIIVEDSKGW